MKQISFIKSLMEFNRRVLFQGTIFPDRKYSIDTLSNRLFFNKVFISNVQEMFQKFDIRPVVEDYAEGLGQYISNINAIIKAMNDEKNDIMIKREDSFERRLSMEGKFADQIMSKTFKSVDDVTDVTYKFLNNHIYYVSLFDNGHIMISYVDMRSAIYQEVISCQMNGYKLYWKTDDCIKDYIRERFSPIDTVAIRVTTHMKKGFVTKAEYNGSTEVMRSLVSMFRDDALVVSNPFIYVDDIEMIIKQNMDNKPPVSKSNFKPVTLEEFLKDDRLIEYPNDSFDEYLQFLSLASKNKNVKSMYMTLYRIGKDPAIFYILRDAALNGIKVHVNIELCATGESINTMWMNELRKAGVKVTTYEAGKIKVHCKLTLVEFENGVSIVQIGTGNYHTQTTAQYTDLSLITSDSDICQQVKKVFNLFKGKDDPDEISFNKQLLVTRYNMRKELIKLIDEEASKGTRGYIAIKCNSLDDIEFISHLDNAAKNGCVIDLIIRGVCTWVPDYDSTNVKIKSIVWDKLEHSRVFYFGRPNPKIYLGSLDLITKKLDERIETMVLVKDPDIVMELCDYLNRYVTNTSNSWLQTSSGLYVKE